MLTSNERILNSKSRFVRISSEDKSIGTNNRFSIDLASNGGIIDNVKGFIVHSAQVPNIFDNINSRNNVVRIFQFGSPVVDIVVPPCYYTLSDLVDYLNTTIAGIIPPTNFVLTFAITGNFPCQKVSATQTGTTPGVFLEFGENNIWETLGFETAAPGITIDDGDTVIATNPPNLIGETECYIHSRVLCPNNLSEASGTFSVVDKIDLNEPYGSMCYTNYNNDTTHQKNYFPFETRKTLRTIDINLRNRTGDLLVLPNNFTFTMMLKIFYV